jgi:hypothetical protein
MKLKNKFMPAMLLAGLVAFTSCEKNEQDVMNPTIKQGSIAQVLADSTEVTSYVYSGSNVSQINNFEELTGAQESIEKFVYDASGRVLESSMHAGSNNALLSEQKYAYNSKGLLTSTTTNYYSSGNIEYSVFTGYEYNSDKKLEKKSVYEGTSADSPLRSYTTYEVLPNGNYSQEKQFVIDDTDTAKLFSTITYSFDTNVNPFYKVAGPGTASSPNNLIASTSLVHGSKKSFTYSYTYQYDERGYPVQQTIVNPSGKREIYRFLYTN